MHLIEAAYFDGRLQEQTKLTLALLVRYAAQSGLIEFFSVKEAADRKGVSRRAIQNQIDKLIGFDYLAREVNKGVGRRNRYFLLFNNLNAYRGVTPLGDTPDSVTQLSDTHVTPSGDISVTPSGHTMKTLENNERKKEKNTRVRDDFLELVKEAIAAHSFQEIGNFSEEIIYTQAKACWDRWDAKNIFPEGNPISEFKGWLRTGLHKGSIKEASNTPKDRNARQGGDEAEIANPLQDWHTRIEPIVGEDILRSWLRECWHDGNGKLCAPSAFKAQRIIKDYSDAIAQVLPNVEIIHQPYKAETYKPDSKMNGVSK